MGPHGHLGGVVSAHTLDDDMIDAAYQQLMAQTGLTDDAAASVPMIEITEAPPDDAPFAPSASDQ
jgi:hypothetical protein